MPSEYDMSPYLDSFKNMIDVKISNMETWLDDNKLYDRQPKSPYIISFCVGIDIETKDYIEFIKGLVKKFHTIISVDKRLKDCVSLTYKNSTDIEAYINADRAEEFNVKIFYCPNLAAGANGEGSMVEFTVDRGGWDHDCFYDPETFFALSFVINYFYDNIKLFAEK